jgi:TPR repeat protein
MGDIASNCVKRPRPQQGEEDHTEPTPLHLTAYKTLPLPLLGLSVVQSLLGVCFGAAVQREVYDGEDVYIGVVPDYAQALAMCQLAAVQNLDWAQWKLGFMYDRGNSVAQDLAEALRLYHLAAAQGHPAALYHVAYCHEEGRGVPENKAEAIRWYRRAQEAGYPGAANALQKLHAFIHIHTRARK